MLIVRHIATKTVEVLDEHGQPVLVDDKPKTQIVPDLDAKGNEQELWSVPVPHSIETKGGEAVDAYVARVLAERAEETAKEAAKAAPAGNEAGHQAGSHPNAAEE